MRLSLHRIPRAPRRHPRAPKPPRVTSRSYEWAFVSHDRWKQFRELRIRLSACDLVLRLTWHSTRSRCADHDGLRLRA